ncbi:UBX domain-containing protein 7 isoform X2 [Prorops nasuta]|uniref:UBX domain-containing protein 7 isoform X2 n=1 Tax=Prorops nasuta TaxID=863751 RepID=UPI0034CDE925
MDRELIEKFIEVTGESEATAHQYLSLAEGNVEAAISLMYEGAQAAPAPLPIEPEPSVRPPILPTQEILVPSDPLSSFPRISNNVFDRFRDFAVETQRQEEELACRATGVQKLSQCKSKRLEDLFRPPCDILFLGTFIEARDHAKTLNRWLLVNVQNPQEFACQILNRDVWPDKQIQEIVKDHFVLWQVLSNTNDGKKYIDFYNVNKYPYLAIVDPRTGECMQTYNHITVDSLISMLNDMLSTHASPDSSTSEFPSSAHKSEQYKEDVKKSSVSVKNDKERKPLIRKLLDSDSSKSTFDVNAINTNIPSGSNILNKRRRIEELNLMEQKAMKSNSKDEQADNKSKSEQYKTEESDEPLLRLCLRLPNGGKETISMCATDTIMKFLNKMEDMGFPQSDHIYLVPFPKTYIGTLPPQLRLLDTILFPSNTFQL